MPIALMSETIERMILLVIAIVLVAFLIKVLIYILIIRAICKYMARQNANAFDYDYLADRTAEEICQRMAIIERQKETAYKDATPAAEDQNTDTRDEAPELNESPHE